MGKKNNKKALLPYVQYGWRFITVIQMSLPTCISSLASPAQVFPPPQVFYSSWDENPYLVTENGVIADIMAALQGIRHAVVSYGRCLTVRKKYIER